MYRPWVLQLNLHFLIVNAFFLMASFRDPGTVKKHESVKFEKIIEKVNPEHLCPTCEIMFTLD
jgi:hypothetical protein